MANIYFLATSALFKIGCGLVAVFMVGFWVYKFEKNDDVSVIEYKSFKSMTDGIYPEMSICISNPFLADKFENDRTNVSIVEYFQYLTGKGDYDDRYKELNFFGVTLNLFDYLTHVVVGKTDSTYEPHNCTKKGSCPFLSTNNSFNGFIRYVFYKCFSVGIQQNFTQNITEVILYFEPKLGDTLQQMKNAGQWVATNVEFTYPNQFVTVNPQFTKIWQTKNIRGATDWIVIGSIEVLKRRNKRKNPCVQDWMLYDDLVFNKHISSVECESPYQHQNGSLCTTKNGMISSKYQLEIVKEKYFPAPCIGLSDIKYRANKITSQKEIKLGVIYPKLMKLINQTPSVDSHALIGNIGGYVGLFLGII